MTTVASLPTGTRRARQKLVHHPPVFTIRRQEGHALRPRDLPRGQTGGHVHVRLDLSALHDFNICRSPFTSSRRGASEHAFVESSRHACSYGVAAGPFLILSRPFGPLQLNCRLRTKVIREGAAEALGLPPGFAVQEIIDGVLAFESEDDAERCAGCVRGNPGPTKSVGREKSRTRRPARALRARTADRRRPSCRRYRSYAVLLEADGHKNLLIADSPANVRPPPCGLPLVPPACFPAAPAEKPQR